MAWANSACASGAYGAGGSMWQEGLRELRVLCGGSSGRAVWSCGAARPAGAVGHQEPIEGSREVVSPVAFWSERPPAGAGSLGRGRVGDDCGGEA